MSGFRILLAALCCVGPLPAAASTYLNDDAGVTAQLGASMGTNVFQNVSDSQSLANMIDLDSPGQSDLHSQSSHVYYVDSATPLEVDFDLGAEYDLVTLHFWNYWLETYSTDLIDFILGDGQGQQVAAPSFVPDEGVNTGESIAPAHSPFAYGGVRYVNARFSGTNGNVDFNNIGWTGSLSAATPVPLPPTGWALLAGLGVLAWRARRAT